MKSRDVSEVIRVFIPRQPSSIAAEKLPLQFLADRENEVSFRRTVNKVSSCFIQSLHLKIRLKP